jgi:hypothetical protein
MRADLAPLAATLLYLFPGVGVLAAAGMLRPTPAGLLGAAGLAYMAGVASVMLVGIALLSAGVALSAAGVSVIAACVGVAGMAAAAMRWRRNPTRPRARLITSIPHPIKTIAGWSAENWLAAIFVAAIAAYAALGYAGATAEPLGGWDSWSVWSRKALLLVDLGKPTMSFYGSQHYAFMHPDYPILLPLYESVFFRIAGTPDFQVLHGQFWILFIAFLWSTGYLMSRVARPLIWAPLVALLAVTPALEVGIRSLYADVPMGLFLGLGTLLVGLWLADRRPGDLAIGALLLAAAASTKNEGLVAAAGVLLVATVAAVVARREGSVRQAVLPPLVAMVALAAAIAPWRLWIGPNPPGGDVSPSKALDPGFLIDRADRIPPTVSAIAGQVGDQSNWYFLLALALAIAIVALRLPSERRLVAFYAGATLTVFASIVVWGYAINRLPLDPLIAVSVERTVDGPMLVAIAGLLHLSGRLLPKPVDEPPDQGPVAESAGFSRAK